MCVQPGSGFNVEPRHPRRKAVADYAGQAKAQSITDFLMHIIPTTVVDAFAKGDILRSLAGRDPVWLCVLCGRARAASRWSTSSTRYSAVFGVVNILMKVAPIGAFGAMAFTVGKYGIASLGPLAKLIGTFWLTSILFVLIVLGAIARVAGFEYLKFLLYIKEEILLVLATSSSETASPP